MNQRLVETVVGGLVLLGGIELIHVAYSSSQLQTVSGYTVTARFSKVGGLQEGNAVRIAGLQVGTLSKQVLDPETYDAVLTLAIRGDVRLPADSVASVSSDGLLGGKFILLQPGKSKETISPGGKIEKTESTVALEELVGRMIFSSN